MAAAATRPIWLALSGGGLRSCSFGAGALIQANKQDITHRPQRLSSVSGGGYATGSWSVWTARYDEKRSKLSEGAADDCCRCLINCVSFFLVAICVLLSLLIPGSQVHSIFDNGMGGRVILANQTVCDMSAKSGILGFAQFVTVTSTLLVSISSWCCLKKARALWTKKFSCRIPVLAPRPANANDDKFLKDYKSKLNVDTAWPEALKCHIGYIVSFDLMSDTQSNLVKCLIGMWVAFWDAIWFLICHLFSPIVLGVLIMLPQAVVFSVLALEQQQQIWWMTLRQRTDCRFFDNQQWFYAGTDPTTNTTTFAITSPTQIVFVIPFFVLIFLVACDLLRYALDWICLRYRQRRSSYYEKPSVEVDFLHSVILLVLLGLGWLSTTLMFFPNACGALADFEVMFQFVIACTVAVLSLVWIPKRGGIVVVSLIDAVFVFVVVQVIGPSPVTVQQNVTLVLQPLEGILAGTKNDTFAQALVNTIRYGWNWYLILAGFVLIVYPMISSAKGLVVHQYYRHRLSRSFFPKSRLRLIAETAKCSEPYILGVSLLMFILPFEWVVHDVFRVPFSFFQFDIFPHDRTRFNEIQHAPSLDVQMAIQHWDVHFNGTERSKDSDFRRFDDGATIKAVFTASSNASAPPTATAAATATATATATTTAFPNPAPNPNPNPIPLTFFKRHDYNVNNENNPVIPFATKIVTAVAVSGAAVGANVGSQHSSWIPSSFLSFFGGCCGRWLRLSKYGKIPRLTCDKAGAPILDSLFNVLWLALFLGLGFPLLLGGLACCPDYRPGTSPCNGQMLNEDTLRASIIAVSILALTMFAVLAIPFAAFALARVGCIVVPFLQNLYAIAGVTVYSALGDPVDPEAPPAAAQGDPRPPVDPEAPAVAQNKRFWPRTVMTSDGGHVENLGLLPLLATATGNEVIVCMDGSELSNEFGADVLLHAVRLSKQLLGFTCTINQGRERTGERSAVDKFFTKNTLRSLPKDDLVILSSMSQHTATGLQNWLSETEPSLSCWCKEGTTVEEEEAQKDPFLKLRFSKMVNSTKMGVDVYYARPRQDNGTKKVFGKLDYVVLPRTVAIFVIVTVLFTLFGLAVEIVIDGLLVECPTISVNTYSRGVLGLILAAILLFLIAISSVSNKNIFQTVMRFLVPAFQVTAAGVVFGSNDFSDFFRQGGYIAMWFIFGSVTSLAIAACIVIRPDNIVGKFPNHSTLMMQAISDREVFSKYSLAGETIYQKIIEDINKGTELAHNDATDNPPGDNVHVNLPGAGDQHSEDPKEESPTPANEGTSTAERKKGRWFGPIKRIFTKSSG